MKNRLRTKILLMVLLLLLEEEEPLDNIWKYAQADGIYNKYSSRRGTLPFAVSRISYTSELLASYPFYSSNPS